MSRNKLGKTSPGLLSSRRSKFLLVVVVFLIIFAAVGILVGNQGAKNPVFAATREATQRLAVASVSPLNSQSSSWYCNWYLPGQGGIKNASILLANTSQKEVTAEVNEYLVDGTLTRDLKIPAHSFLRYPETISAKSQMSSTSFIANGGGMVAELELTGQLGSTVAPCNSSPSANWTALGGNTLPGTLTGVSIFNPFNQSAVVDLSLSSTSQQLTPGALQGIVIAPHKSKNINITQYFSGQSHVSASVNTRIGRVVVGGLVQRSDQGHSGLAALSTTPAPESLWRFPVGEISTNQNQTFLIYNPNTYEVKVDAKFSYLNFQKAKGITTTTTTTTTLAKKTSKKATSGTESTVLPNSSYQSAKTIAPHTVGVISVKEDTSVELNVAYQAAITVDGGHGVIAAETYSGSPSNPNTRYQIANGLPLVTQHWIALFDPGALGISNTQAWLSTVATGNNNPISQKTPLVDLGPTYLAPPGQKAAALPQIQAQVARTSKSVISSKKHLNSVGQLAQVVTGLIVSSRTPFAFGSVMGSSPADLYVVPALPFAN